MIHIEENDKNLSKKQVKEFTKKPNFKDWYGPSYEFKIEKNDKGIWRRINNEKED